MVQAFFLNSFKEPACRLFGHKSARFFFHWHSSYTNTQFETDTYLSKFVSSWCIHRSLAYNKVQDLFTQIYRWTTTKKLCTRVSLVKQAVSFFCIFYFQTLFFVVWVGVCVWFLFYMSANKGYMKTNIFLVHKNITYSVCAMLCSCVCVCGVLYPNLGGKSSCTKYDF